MAKHERGVGKAGPRKTLSKKQQEVLEQAPMEAEIQREKRELAKRLWGNAGTPEKLDAKFQWMEDQITTLRQQNEDYNRALNDRANVEAYILRFNKTIVALHQMADACVEVARKLRRVHPVKTAR